MNRRLTPCILAAVMCVAAAAPAFAQFDRRRPAVALVQTSASPHADLHGVVLDAGGLPLAGAVVSAFGSTTMFAVSAPDGRYAFRNLPYGPYMVRAHLQGYLPPRARLIQVNRSSLTVSAIALTRHGDSEESTPVLAAGVGGAEATSAVGDEADNHDHGEVAWRLRHLKRSVLRDTGISLIDNAGHRDSFLDDSLAGLGWAIGTPARLASSLFADVPWNGHIDLLTSTSFDRPQDLLSMQAWPPRGVAFVALETPSAGGQWTMHGAVTQGDLSSWILAGAFRRSPAAHRYEAGLSYGVQSFIGPGAATRAGSVEGGRNVGSIYAYDDWTITPKLSVNYGAKYARYDYLADRSLLSPRASVTVTPTPDETFKLRAAVSRRVTAPGAEEFMPPAAGLWLPPERTFSALSPRLGFTSERLQHVELSAERAWPGDVVVGLRAFRQHVDDQLATLFGVTPGGVAVPGVSHYYVASAGDFNASGWGVSVNRSVTERLQASVDYTHIESTWLGHSPEGAMVTLWSLAARPPEHDEFHEMTASVASTLPVTETRVFVVYKLNSRFVDTGGATTRPGVRFDFQLTQALPFLSIGGAEWEMLLAVRSLFREELFDTSVYDELLVVRPPKRVVGGVTVRF